MMINFRTLACFCVALSCSAFVGDEVQAQSNFGSTATDRFKSGNSVSRFSTSAIRGQLAARSVSRVGVPGVNRRSFSNFSQKSKPFKNLNRGPTVSPYLALSGSLNGVSDYYNIVRPQQNQARENARLQQRTLANRHRLNQLAAAGPYNLRGDPNLAPTGHSATYMFFDNFQRTGGFYPAPQGLTKQQ